MTLETIVPELETCRKIPQGAFKDSALVYVQSIRKTTKFENYKETI